MNNNLSIEDLDTEMHVIGEMFKNPDAAIWFFSNLKPDEFSADGICGEIYAKAKTRFEYGRPFDAVSICEDFRGDTEFRHLLYGIILNVVDTENYKEHCRLLKNKAGRKKLREIGNDAMILANGNDATITQMQTFLADRLEDFDCNDLRKTETALEGMTYFLEHADEKREYILTGIEPIDSVLKISKGDYVIMGARPSVGKTAFALQVAFFMGFKHKTVFFSFETNSQKIYDRVIANQCSIPFPRIIRGQLAECDKMMVKQSLTAVKKNRFTVVEAAGMTVAEIQAEAVRQKADVIFIDYLGLVNCEDEKLMEYERVTKVSKDLHNMAQKRQITVFALSQMNREGKDNPDMSNLRSSGQIEADADSVLLMSKAKNIETHQETGRAIQIAKNKVGELGKLYMHFDGDYQKFEKCEKDELYE